MIRSTEDMRGNESTSEVHACMHAWPGTSAMCTCNKIAGRDAYWREIPFVGRNACVHKSPSMLSTTEHRQLRSGQIVNRMPDLHANASSARAKQNHAYTLARRQKHCHA